MPQPDDRLVVWGLVKVRDPLEAVELDEDEPLELPPTLLDEELASRGEGLG